MDKHLNFGVYETTDAFRSIKQHSCVCFDDMGLVAVTGPADDKDAQKYAELFAAAPDMLSALAGIQEYATEILNDMAADAQAGGKINQCEFDRWSAVIAAFASVDDHNKQEASEFPVYYDARGNEHAEY